MKNKIYLGAAYYPELWDEAEVDKDIERCRALGINTLRVGEFAWGTMEPKAGEYHLDWLQRIVEKLYRNGIYTIMCTPTATPPRWMLNKYPEMRRVLPDLSRSDVSSRCHVCKSSHVAREENAKIVTEMAKAFTGQKGIIGWQIDNEIYPYDGGCYCENCKKGFRAYLKEKFGTTERLNKAWGMARWSLEYESFEAVEPPYPSQWRHPSLYKAWWDFQCSLIKTYVEEQADILHRYGCRNVGTDMMALDYLDYYAVNEKLDIVQYNHYDTADRLYTNAFAYDFLRCVKDRPFWVTETQVGWNGSVFADCGYRPQGNCYVNTWLPIAKGGQMNSYWLFRAHPNGHEVGHGALYSAAGRSYRVSEEVKKAGGEISKCEAYLTGSKIVSKIALNYSATALNTFAAAPLLKDLDYRQKMIEYHAAFRHYNVDVIDTPHSLEGYEVLISPFLAVANENGFQERVTEWVKEGGNWNVWPMTDIMDGNVTRFTHAPYGFLEELAGVYVKYQKPVHNEVFKAEWTEGGECGIGTCFDAFECNAGTKSLAHYTAGEFAPLSVITERNVGKGKVILLGSVIPQKDLLKLVALPPIAKASDNVILTERDNGVIVLVEIENLAGYVELDGKYIDLLTERRLNGKIAISPYEVLVLKKE